MGSDNLLDQNEIERLLGGGSSSPPPTPPSSPPPPASEPSGVLNQSELDALFGTASPSAPATSSPTDSAGDSTAKQLDQSELDSLFGKGAATTTPKSTSPATASTTPTQTPKSPATASPPLFSPASKSQQPIRPTAFAPPLPSNSMPEYRDNVGVFDEPDAEEDEDNVPRGDIDYLLKRADDSLRSIASTPMDLPTEVIEFQFPEFGGTVPSTEHATLDQISEVELDVKIELGRTNMYLEDVLKLRKGSVVPLDKMAGDAVDIFINGRLLARGEVLVMNENFCVRVAELLAGAIPME
ncbi:MAG: flagellar motor switch protein FliN [Planctomycetaceae bacterium]|jgi:flagellar motor switch protein FliN/FliY|nr:flagellar motor switch protein FliN [Planctomycetaceae bacterium]